MHRHSPGARRSRAPLRQRRARRRGARSRAARVRAGPRAQGARASRRPSRSAGGRSAWYAAETQERSTRSVPSSSTTTAYSSSAPAAAVLRTCGAAARGAHARRRGAALGSAAWTAGSARSLCTWPAARQGAGAAPARSSPYCCIARAPNCLKTALCLALVRAAPWLPRHQNHCCYNQHMCFKHAHVQQDCGLLGHRTETQHWQCMGLKALYSERAAAAGRTSSQDNYQDVFFEDRA